MSNKIKVFPFCRALSGNQDFDKIVFKPQLRCQGQDRRDQVFGDLSLIREQSMMLTRRLRMALVSGEVSETLAFVACSGLPSQCC